jgi:hypothetical protein
MAKSNGIKSLQQAAKLLNKHAPEGESLAYINPKEARLLKAHGGSGIMTVAGVPSYWEWLDTLVDWVGDAPGKIWNAITGRYEDQDAVYSKEYPNKMIERGRSGIGTFVQDAIGIYGALRAKKDAEGLNEAEMAEFNRLQAQLTAAQTQFSEYTDAGSQLKAPTNVPTTISDVAQFTETTGRPDMITTPVAEGGRIGYNKGSPGDRYSYLIDKVNKGIPLTPPEAKELQMLEITYADVDRDPTAQGGRIGYNLGGIDTPFQGIGALNPRMGYQEGTHPLDGVAIEMFGITFENLNPLQQIVVTQSQSKAYGGRIGYQNAGITKLASHEGNDAFLEQRYEYYLEQGFSPRKAAEQAQKDLTEGNYQDLAQGGRIGAQKGGIMPLLNLGGMEKDYRQDGGFVPIGRKEKADDVPARLSKNEFVFTADAVRAAGGGDIDQGAQRMYNVMKNLEAGGEISPQSQGKA